MTKMVRGLDHFIRMGVTTSKTPTGVQAQTSPGHTLLHLSLSRFLYGMMRLSPHNTVTGGTTHGWCTVH